MRPEYPRWLIEQKYKPQVQSARISELNRIENAYGDIDKNIADGKYQEIMDSLKYTKEDERKSKPHPPKIIINGDLYDGLASLRSALRLYCKFLTNSGLQSNSLEKQYPISNIDIVSNEESQKQRLSLERDMQVALRRNIKSLEPTLRIIDDGAERAVDSGLIDITCEDDNSIVVVELKAGKADSRAIAQILGYMGDLKEEDDTKPVRGILVAHDFDKRTKSAASVVPTLKLMKYSIEFKFMTEE